MDVIKIMIFFETIVKSARLKLTTRLLVCENLKTHAIKGKAKLII